LGELLLGRVLLGELFLELSVEVEVEVWVVEVELDFFRKRVGCSGVRR
jgi:hypothetical protein